jgi:hypothetical protein
MAGQNYSLNYDAVTGIFTWKERRRTVAGSIMNTGYIKIKFRGKYYLAHRLAWQLIHGDIPEGMEVDHINGVLVDNRICNLRLVTDYQQRANSKKNRNNRSGFRGVCWHKKKQVWRAVIAHKWIGDFASAAEASAAYEAAFVQRYGAEFRRAA